VLHVELKNTALSTFLCSVLVNKSLHI
jgi:hypothetical protein